VLAEADQMIQPNDIPVYDDGGERAVENAVPSGVMDEPTTPPRTESWRSSRRNI